MLRRLLSISLAGALVGCQSYNFSPVGKCFIQPGSTRFQLSSLSVADVLFVVDDSGSMQDIQTALAANFNTFINKLADVQQTRARAGLDPFEFHIAVTTSSVFEGQTPNGNPVCQAGQTPTCTIATPFPQVLQSGAQPWGPPYSYTCDTPGAACPDLVQDYYGSGCTLGVGAVGQPFPRGDFVAKAGNPRVIHFTKDLAWSTWGTNAVDQSITAKIRQFQENIAVGTCGSGMEQHLEASRLAVKKALRQDGLKQPGDVMTDEWPHPNAKMVVVWVGDEDDCSNPNDPNKALVFTAGHSDPGADVCLDDERATSPKQFPVHQYADFFAGLGRSFGAAFIYSATNCQDDGEGNTVCSPGVCGCKQGDPPRLCTGKSDGTRFSSLGKALRSHGVKTFESSVCDSDFATKLSRIADLVKPLDRLTLPTQPAAGEVAALRIQSADGTSSRLCTGPGPGLDWNFVDCDSGVALPAGATADAKGRSCVAINHDTGHCEANPGETYIAQYLGVVPAGGCASTTDCSAALGGRATDWLCTAQGSVRGTCLCNGAQ